MSRLPEEAERLADTGMSLRRAFVEDDHAVRDEILRTGSAVTANARDSSRASEVLEANARPADLRARASLVIRCADCRGRILAHVTYVDGRPLLWSAQRRGSPGSRVYIDGGFWGDTAHCLVREWHFYAAALLAVLPAAGEPMKIVRVSHDDPTDTVP